MKKIILIAGVLLGALLLSSFSPDPKLTESIKRGKEVYITYCQSCHMEDGKGLPGLNPPLAQADYLKKSSATLVNVILKGQSGEVVVNGKKYNAMMPAQEYLSDEEIADVLNFVRNSWGNKIAGTITPAFVKSLRK
jgi:nitrite reductase (NO-forming)